MGSGYTEDSPCHFRTHSVFDTPCLRKALRRKHVQKTELMQDRAGERAGKSSRTAVPTPHITTCQSSIVPVSEEKFTPMRNNLRLSAS